MGGYGRGTTDDETGDKYLRRGKRLMKCDGCQYYGQERAQCKTLHKLRSEIICAVQGVHVFPKHYLYPLRERCTCFPEALFVPSSGKVYSVPKTRDFVHLSRKSALFPGKWIFWDSLQVPS